MKLNVYKKTKKISVIILCMMLVVTGFTGCGSDNEPQVTEEVKADSGEHEKAVEVVDGSLKADSTVVAVGQTAVPYSEYTAYYYFMESQYDELLGDQVWKQSVEKDKTIGQEAIEDVLRMIIQIKVINKEAERQGVSLEPDEKEDADYNAQKFCDTLDEKTMHDSMISVNQITKIFEENRLAEKMYNVITGGITAGDGQAMAYRVQLLYKEAGKDREKARQEINALQEKIASSNRSFYAMAKNETDLPKVEAVVGSMDERKNLWNTIISQNVGVISPVIEENDGFYIVNVVERPTDELNTEYQNNVVSEKQISAFQKQYEGWSANYDVEVSKSLLS